MRLIVLYISLVVVLLGCSSEKGGSDYRSVASLWSYARRGTTLITDDIYIKGYILANDKYGELNGAIVVADDSAGVMIELDMDDVESCFPLHSMVKVRCSGLWLGSVGAKLMLGDQPVGEYVVDKIAASKAQNYILPLAENSNTPTLRQRKIAELEYRDMLSYVVVDSISIIATEQGLKWTDIDTLSGRPITTLRHFCAEGDTLRVVTDARCHYAFEAIPSGCVRLAGILDWYDGDIALRIADHNI